ncbi:uncharacterized protein LOC127422170 [Myxocyprinus asiaticus]|uniref:uncharacterized protein LOC127422170 n=1 Tax=Myxocyprinus asiaticus TaxID=70543 RepID=UPI0022236108|nr:uncharacterized protein LOC127422170 [Myxocyprinus asiaticus]
MPERNTLFSYTGSPYSLLHNVLFNSSFQDEDEELLSDDSDGPTTRTDSTSTSLTGSTVTITTSINTLHTEDDNQVYPQDSFDSESESESSASEQDSPIPDRSPVCSPKHVLYPSNDEEITELGEMGSTLCSKKDEEERDKFIPSSRNETEKYKVSRTLSFLRSRMVNTKIKNKVNAKVGSALHQLCSPQQPLNAACELCEQNNSDELLQCTCEC